MENRGRYFVVCGLALITASVFVSGCIPISIPLDLTVADGVSLDLGDLQPGQTLAASFEKDFNFCETWPSLDDLRTELGQAGSFLTGLLQIQSVTPESVILTATGGNLSSIQDIALTLVLPDGSTVGMTGQTSGDGTEFLFTPEGNLDLMAILQQFGGVDSCVTLKVTAAGAVPNPMPTFSIEVKGTIVVLV